MYKKAEGVVDEAYIELARCYDFGIGTEASDYDALNNYAYAADDAHSADACFRLGEYYMGENEEAAWGWWRMAAARGNERAKAAFQDALKSGNTVAAAWEATPFAAVAQWVEDARNAICNGGNQDAAVWAKKPKEALSLRFLKVRLRRTSGICLKSDRMGCFCVKIAQIIAKRAVFTRKLHIFATRSFRQAQ